MRSLWQHYLNGWRRLRIRHCGLSPAEQAQIAERLKDRDYYRRFDEIYEKAHQAGARQLFDGDIYGVLERVLDRFLSRHVVASQETAGIDFGCGEGINTLYMARRGLRVTGIDISPAAITRARELAAQAGMSATYHVGDVLDLPMCAPGAFDFGVNIGCLHMLVLDEHRRRHLREMARVLKPGGWLLSFNEIARRDVIIKDPERYLASFIAVEETKPVEVGGRWAEIQFKGVGFRKASEAQYRAEFEQAGFEIVQTETVGRKSGWPQWLRWGRGAGQRFLVLHARKRA